MNGGFAIRCHHLLLSRVHRSLYMAELVDCDFEDFDWEEPETFILVAHMDHYGTKNDVSNLECEVMMRHVDASIASYYAFVKSKQLKTLRIYFTGLFAQ